MIGPSTKVLKPFESEPSNPTYPQVTICDKNPALCRLLAEMFAQRKQVEIRQGDLFTVKADALISPANSFGDMSGGIDREIDQLYQGRAQQKLTDLLRREFFGELPVGMAVIMLMETRLFPFLIAAPTMRIPGRLALDSINVYLAMRAILVRIIRHNETHATPIRSIVMPGIGTGVGGMDHAEAANQMLTAYQNVCEGGWREVVHPALSPYVGRR